MFNFFNGNTQHRSHWTTVHIFVVCFWNLCHVKKIKWRHLLTGLNMAFSQHADLPHWMELIHVENHSRVYLGFLPHIPWSMERCAMWTEPNKLMSALVTWHFYVNCNHIFQNAITGLKIAQYICMYGEYWTAQHSRDWEPEMSLWVRTALTGILTLCHVRKLSGLE